MGFLLFLRCAAAARHISSSVPRREKSYTKIAQGVGKEFLASALTVLSVFLLRSLVQWLLGRDLLWDLLPVRYCADTVDAVVFVRFIWQLIRRFDD